ncbi:MAG TPA: GTP-binding protein [Eoetvoesiella sp.]
MKISQTQQASPDTLSGKLPICLITGFLGSGKTTIISHLLQAPGMDRVAVIVNELGDVGLDHELMSSTPEQISLLANGCLCCTVRTDLQETLRELFIKRRNGEIIDFNRVVIETTGLADPVPAIHALQNDALISTQYRLDSIVTVVDAVNGLHNIEHMYEARKQIAVADRLLVTKTDLVTQDKTNVLGTHLAQLNPMATQTVVLNGKVDPDLLINIGLSTSRPELKEIQRWLPDLLEPEVEVPDKDHYMGLSLRNKHNFQHHDIQAFTLILERSYEWNVLASTLHLITSIRGADVLRIKGLVKIDGEPGPVVVQGAQHFFHPPVTLQSWPSDKKNPRLTFITRNLSREAVSALFTALNLLEHTPTQI